MRRLREIWRSWSVRRRLLVVGSACLVVAGGAVAAYLLVKRPDDKACPAPCSLHKTHEAEKAPVKTVNWPVYGYDIARTRYLPSQRVHPPYEPSIWSFQAGRLLEFSPIIADHFAYFMDKEALFYALDDRTGKLVWKQDLGSLNATSPAFAHNRLYAATMQPGQIAALDPANGKVIWRHPLPDKSETSPVVFQNKVIVGCACGTVYALDAKTGKTEWTVSTGSPVKGGVAVDDGDVFFGNYGGQVYAVDASDGHTKWTAQTQGGGFLQGGGVYSTPSVAFGRVFVGSLDGRVYSYEEHSGQLQWSHSTGAEVYPGPAVADTPNSPPTVYIGSADKHFYALDARTGEERWSHDVGGVVLGAASVVGNTVYMSVIGPNVGTFGFNTDGGHQVFQNDVGEYNPVTSDSRRLYLTGESEVRAFRPEPPHPNQHKKGQGAHQKPSGQKGHGSQHKQPGQGGQGAHKQSGQKGHGSQHNQPGQGGHSAHKQSGHHAAQNKRGGSGKNS